MDYTNERITRGHRPLHAHRCVAAFFDRPDAHIIRVPAAKHRTYIMNTSRQAEYRLGSLTCQVPWRHQEQASKIRNRRLNSVALLDPLRSVQFSSGGAVYIMFSCCPVCHTQSCLLGVDKRGGKRIRRRCGDADRVLTGTSERTQTKTKGNGRKRTKKG